MEGESVESSPGEIKGWVAIGTGFVSFIAGASAFVQKVRNHGNRIKSLEKAVAAIPEDIKRRLYDHESQPIYQPVGTCEKMQARCAEGLKDDVNRLEGKIDRLVELHLKD